jgi:hypothetical protein
LEKGRAKCEYERMYPAGEWRSIFQTLSTCGQNERALFWGKNSQK